MVGPITSPHGLVKKNGSDLVCPFLHEVKNIFVLHISLYLFSTKCYILLSDDL